MAIITPAQLKAEIYANCGFNLDTDVTQTDIVPDTTIGYHITSAQAAIERYLHTKLEPTAVTETLYGTNDVHLILSNIPVISPITSLTIDDTSITPSEVYVNEDRGMLILKDNAEESSFKNTKNYPLIEVTYNYGYATGECPQEYKNLVVMLASIMTLATQTGGTFDDPSTISLPSFSYSIGQAYVNIKGAIDNMLVSYKEMLKSVKPKPQVA